MTAAKALTWDQPLYYVPTRVTGQTVVSSSRRLPVVRTETRGKITYLHFNISTNDQTMVKAWPAHVIERINPMPDETNDATNGETQPVEVENTNALPAKNDDNPRGVTVAEAEASISKVRQNIAQTASETPDTASADDAPAAGEGVDTDAEARERVRLLSFAPDIEDVKRDAVRLWIAQTIADGYTLHASVGTRDYVTLIYVRMESE